MKIVAFMQNMWLKNPDSFHRNMAGIKDVAEKEKYRRRIIHYALFAGCLTGRRLKYAFEEDVCRRIIWEESTREIASDPRKIFPAQPEHIKAVLEIEKPDVVITFGKIASNALAPLWKGRIVTCIHPAARDPLILSKLKIAAEDLKTRQQSLAL